MKALVVVILLRFHYAAMFINSDHDDFSPPTWPSYNSYTLETNSQIDKAPVVIDESSGCMCRQVYNQLSVCFGRDSCQQFPKSIEINSTNLRIKSTKITIISKGDLDQISHLYTLDIEANYYLVKIEEGTFENMSQLSNMSISYNTNLKVLELRTFEGLVNLQDLFLIKNGFDKIIDVSVALAPRYLPNIVKLSLSENTFRYINKNDFATMNGSNLKELNCVLCQIEQLHPETLSPLRNLSVLRLGENQFNDSVISNLIATSIKLDIPLRVLNLYDVGFRKSPPKSLLKIISNSNITHLCMAKNQFEVISNETFIPMPQLQFLDLRESLTLNITKNAFTGIPNLNTLLLSGNKLSSVPDGVLLPRLTYLDVSLNSGNVYLPSYFSLGKNKFLKMKKLKYLNLSFNQINILFNETFNGLSHLNILGLRNATIYHIEEGAFRPLKKLVFLSLENNNFARNAPIPSSLFNGLENLEILLLGGCLIYGISNSSDIFRNLPNLLHLGLERNLLLTLPGDIFDSLTNLVSIDISKNLLSPWQETIFDNNTKLSIINANRNKFSYFSKAMLQDFANLSRLDVSYNPFTCDCMAFLPLDEWIHDGNSDKILKLVDENPTFCVYPDQTGDQTVVQFFESIQNHTSSCSFPYKSHLVLLYVLPLVTFAIVLLGTIALVYIYRWKIRYWAFLLRINVFQFSKMKNKKDFKSYVNYQYDAFVSYSNEDCNFVVRLVAMLENFEPFLKLCVYERDFKIGSVISESVLESVAQSRKTVLIISDSYARSQWCRWEVQIAEHHRLFFSDDSGHYSDDSLIMIKLGDVSDVHMTPTLKYLLKTRIYLEWNSDPKKQKIFWNKLRNILTPPKYDSCV